MHDEMKGWLERSKKGSLEGIKTSRMMMSLVSQESLDDPLCALQLGYAIMHDKPLMLVVDRGTKLPAALTRAALRIEVCTLGDKADMERAMNAITEFAKVHVKELK